MPPAAPRGPVASSLGDKAIHIWTVALDKAAPPVDLPPDEAAWIDAAVDQRTRRRRHIARAALRTLIGHYLDRDPAGLRFRRGDHGKPRLAGHELAFNLSHSDDLMLVALAAHREIGIDIDRLDRLGDDWRGVARLSLSVAEHAALSSFPPAERGREAMRLWIRKEAYTKARGGGYAHGFPAVTVGLAARVSASGVRDDADPANGAGWSLVDLPVAPPIAAALAYAGDDASISYAIFSNLIGGSEVQ